MLSSLSLPFFIFFHSFFSHPLLVLDQLAIWHSRFFDDWIGQILTSSVLWSLVSWAHFGWLEDLLREGSEDFGGRVNIGQFGVSVFVVLGVSPRGRASSFFGFSSSKPLPLPLPTKQECQFVKFSLLFQNAPTFSAFLLWWSFPFFCNLQRLHSFYHPPSRLFSFPRSFSKEQNWN